MPHQTPFMDAPSATPEARTQIIAALLTAALARLDEDQDFARSRIEQAAILVGCALRPVAAVGGLAPWQKVKAASFIDCNLEGPVRIAQVAVQVRLGPNYFSRAFKISFGQSFSHYLIARRIERAKILLKRSEHPICQIAVACGFSDQAHLSRLFRRSVGVAPAVWRRSVSGGPGIAEPPSNPAFNLQVGS